MAKKFKSLLKSVIDVSTDILYHEFKGSISNGKHYYTSGHVHPSLFVGRTLELLVNGYFFTYFKKYSNNVI